MDHEDFEDKFLADIPYGGWIIRLPHGKKLPPPAGTTGKNAKPPEVPIEYNEAEMRNHNHNYALRVPNGYRVLDIEGHHCVANGKGTALMAALAEHGLIKRATRTPSGGYHIFIKSSDLSEPQLYWDGEQVGDILQPGHRYTILPPSYYDGLDKAGNREKPTGYYTWAVRETQSWDALPTPDAEIVAKMSKPKRGRGRPQAGDEKIPAGGRHDALVSMVGKMIYGTHRKTKVGESNVAALIEALQHENERRCDPPHSYEHIVDITNDIANAHNADPKHTNVNERQFTRDDFLAALKPTVEDYTVAALERILEKEDIKLRLNTRSTRLEYSEEGGEWREATDGWQTRLRDRLSADYRTAYGFEDDKGRFLPWKPSTPRWEELIKAIQEEAMEDPLLQIYESLEWDGVDRIDHALHELFDAEDTDLNRWAWRALFLALVARTYAPGCKYDVVVILAGDQGIGKSALAQALPHNPEWFTDNYKLKMSEQRQVEAIAGNAIVEIAEMAQIRKIEVEDVKSVVSRQVDRIRPAYGRGVVALKRNGIFVGTANDTGSGILPEDPSGSDRWVVLELNGSKCAVEPYLRNWRDDLFAEAVAKYKSEEWRLTARLPRELKGSQAEINAKYEDRDSLVDVILNHHDQSPGTIFELALRFDVIDSGGQGVELCTDSGLQGKLHKGVQRRVSTALKGAGWSKERVRRDGKQIVLWSRDVHSVHSCAQ